MWPQRFGDDSGLEIEVQADWDGPVGLDSPIRVSVSLLHSTLLGIWLPTKTFLVLPDGRAEV